MEFSMDMTIAALVEAMNNGGNQKELYNASKISKDVLPYIFRAGGYVRDQKNQKYEPTAEAQPELTIEQLLPLAKAMRQEAKAKKPQQPQKATKATKARKTAVQSAAAEVAATASALDFANKAEMQSAILEVLDLTPADLEALRALKGEAPAGTIYEAVSKLQSRRRANKTYYVSEEIAQQVQEFTEARAIKTSQFVEIALLEAMQKYGR